MTRRGAMKRLMGGATALTAASAVPARLLADAGRGARLSDGTLTIEFDSAMRSRLSRGALLLTAMEPADAIRLDDNHIVDRFLLLDQQDARIAGEHGAGRRHILRGSADGRIEKQQTITFLGRYPGLALIETRYRNTGDAPLAIAGWHAATHDLLNHPDGAWSFAGASYPD